MARPDVTISASDPLFSGRDLSIEVNVTSIKETKIDFIQARLEGDQGWSIGSGKSRVTQRLAYPMLMQQLSGPGLLPAASTTTYTTAFRVPSGTPPTHELAPAWSRMRLSIHISIPWALDGRYRYDFSVRIPAPGAQRRPAALSSSDVPGKPRLELGLASTEVIIGEGLVGTCAVFHLGDEKPREVELALVPELLLLGRGHGRERRGTPIATTLTLPAGSAGTGIPFTFTLPPSMIPSFDSPTHALRWWLVARTGSLLSGRVKLEVPLQVMDRSAAGTAPRLNAAPRVGDERVDKVFAQFAARSGWRDGEPGPDDLAIEQDLGEITVRIAYAYREETGTFLVASAHTPWLGLGLSVAPSSSVRHVFFKDVEIDNPAWDRAHHVRARYPEQVIPFLKATVPLLMECGVLGPMVRWNDGALVFERAIVSVDGGHLEETAAQLTRIAEALARGLDKIPPPPSVVVDVPAWRSLAGWLGGTLLLGDLGIHGELEGAAVVVGLGWSKAGPTHVQVDVGHLAAESEHLGQLELRLAKPARDILSTSAPERLVELITGWPDDVVDLEIEEGVVSASLRLPGGASPVVDAERVRDLIGSLRAVFGALLPVATPYR